MNDLQSPYLKTSTITAQSYSDFMVLEHGVMSVAALHADILSPLP